jgi:hypothetical protein
MLKNDEHCFVPLDSPCAKGKADIGLACPEKRACRNPGPPFSYGDIKSRFLIVKLIIVLLFSQSEGNGHTKREEDEGVQ